MLDAAKSVGEHDLYQIYFFGLLFSVFPAEYFGKTNDWKLLNTGAGLIWIALSHEWPC